MQKGAIRLICTASRGFTYFGCTNKRTRTISGKREWKVEGRNERLLRVVAKEGLGRGKLRGPQSSLGDIGSGFQLRRGPSD